uniref:Uncharacterized protein n=1 Tax=Caenorhabditis japonica TaxID=281687 RepID=A0A8R1DLG4_CAEJA
MSGIFNLTSLGNAISKAPVREFSSRTMPAEMADLHAWHFRKQGKSKAEEKKDKNGDTKEKSAMSEKYDASESEAEKMPKMRTETRKVRYTKLVKNGAADWDDVGSQTDHSDLSEGHYSDETSEEKFHRETRNEVKRMKRLDRLEKINLKHGIH